MQKHILVFISAFFLAIPQAKVRAQVKIGPEAGVNFGMQRSVQPVDSSGNSSQNSILKVGALAGINVDIKVLKRCYIQTGLLYTYDNIKFKEEVDFTAAGLGTAYLQRSTNLHYIKLPLYLMYKSGYEGSGRFMAGAGPYIAYAFLANQSVAEPYTLTDSTGQAQKIGYIKTSRQLKLGNDAARDQLKAWDYGVNACIGYESNIGLFFRGNFSWGFQNLVPGGDASHKLNNWGMGISIGYNIGRDDW